MRPVFDVSDIHSLSALFTFSLSDMPLDATKPHAAIFLRIDSCV